MEIFEEERKHLVYKHTSPSGKCYIGITDNYKRRCKQHQANNNYCRLFALAIKKYGWDNFTHEILEENLTLEEANNKEAEYITKYNSMSPNGYNLKAGGNLNILSEETKKKLRGQHRGNSSGESGIRHRCNKYSVEYVIDNKTCCLGTYNTLEDAIEARDLGVKTDKASNDKKNKLGENGILKTGEYYTVALYKDGKILRLGTYNTLEDAIEARDLGVKTDKANSIKVSNTGISGIYEKDGLYRVVIRKDNKSYNIGIYSSIEDAIEAKILGIKTDKNTISKKSNTGLLGITKIKDYYRVRVTVDSVSISLGSYYNIEDAIEARDLKLKTKNTIKKESNTGIYGITKIGNSYRVIVQNKHLGVYNDINDAIEAKNLQHRTEKANKKGYKSKCKKSSEEIKLKTKSNKTKINEVNTTESDSSSMSGIYLRENKKYQVLVKGLYLGTYDNLEDAIEAKNSQIKTNKANTIKESKIGETGIQLLRGFYVVTIKIKGKKINLGHYNNLEDAIEARDNKTKTSKANDRKKSKLGEEGINLVGNSYRVIIKVNGETLRLGMYSNLDDALEAKRLQCKTEKANKRGYRPENKEPTENQLKD